MRNDMNKQIMTSQENLNDPEKQRKQDREKFMRLFNYKFNQREENFNQ